MKRKLSIFCLIALLISNFSFMCYAQVLSVNSPDLTFPYKSSNEFVYKEERRINFNDNWRFQRETGGSIPGAWLPTFDDSSWRKLDLPHDWSIELDFNPASPATHEGGFLDGGIGWYRKTFTLPSSMEGKCIAIDFDGVYMNSTTYLNGQALGTYPYGYNAFTYDITDKVYTDGRENVLVVKVNNTQPSSRWYSGSGIYRNVHLTVTNPIHVARYGTFVTTPNLEIDYAHGRVGVNIKTKVNNRLDEVAEIKVKSIIYDADGKIVASMESEAKNVQPDAVINFKDNAVIQNPILWDIDNPYRYKLVTEVIYSDEVVDNYETPFGLRYFKFDKDEGFSLNGRDMKLHGVCMHHDLGALGATTNYRAVERQMQIMKDMGANAIRVTHNPASLEFLEVCNNLGLLVIEEAFDCWKQPKKTYDYARFFSKWTDRFSCTWAEHDIKEMVDRDKNEPCIIMWSIGNEIWGADGPKGAEIARNLVRWIKEVDTTRPTTIGQDKLRGNKVNPTLPLNANIKAVLDEVDVAGLNYAENNYVAYRDEFDWTVYGSETSSATRSRGIYTHPYKINEMGIYPDKQQSSYDNDHVGWGRTAEDSWKKERDLKHVAGQFIWTGFDYIGEPTPYYNSFPAKSSYFGAVDTAGFPKDIFYYYQSQWKSEPMVHLLPHWNWKAGEDVRILAYTNVHKVELFLNGVSLGEKSYENKTTSWGAPYKETAEGKTYLEWKVPFEAGTLEAVAKDKEDKIIARDKVVTADSPAAVRLTADRQVITADGKDLSFITVDIVDGDGNIVPTADNLIQFNISGNGELVGVDNGNAASIERYKDNKRKAFSGKALAIIQSNKVAGEISMTATSAGLAGDSIRIFTAPSDEQAEPTIVGLDSINVTVEVNEVPILPSTIKVHYSDSSVETKNVVWDNIDPSSYEKIGKFAVEGRVDGISGKAKAYVTVKGPAAIKPYSTVVKIGVMPELPTKVTMICSDDSTKDVSVTWDAIPEDNIREPGSFTVEGEVSESDLKAKAYIRVTNETQRVNVILHQEGEDFPKLNASYTCVGDSLFQINDGIISYSDTPKNRWSNWAHTPRNSGDSITVDFGKNYTIDNLDLFIYTDHGCNVPGSVFVQYWDGSEWVNVRNQKAPLPYVQMKNEISFDSVTTDKIKFHMTPSETNKFVALTEVEVYADKIAMGKTAKLNSITINGKPLEGFSPDKQSYELILPYGSKLPKVEVVPDENATATILPAFDIPGAAKIYVASEDGLKYSVYVINMLSREAKLISAELSAEKTEIIEDDIIDLKLSGKLESGEVVDLSGLNPIYSFDNKEIIKIENDKLYALGEGQVKVKATVTYKGFTVTTPEVIFNIARNAADKQIVSIDPVKIIVDIGTQPVLPATVKAHYDVGLPRDVSVIWDDIDPSNFGKPGEFTVIGKVEGTSIRPKARIVVKGVLAVENVSIAVLTNQMPELPQKITVYFSDATQEQLDVEWDDISDDNLNKIGVFKIQGFIEGIELKPKASIRVTDVVGDVQNISMAKNGYEFPKAEASFTNRGPSSNDRIEAVNDGIISYEAEPHNRWTNWQREPRSGDWVSIIFGDYEPEEYYVDNLEVHWFDDGGTSFPESYKVQYKSGGNWADVTSLKKEPGIPTLKRANYHTFDRVKTSAIRLDMVAKPGRSLAITEMKIFTEWVKANSEPKVTDIKLGESSILDDFVKNGKEYEYSVVVKSADALPQITARGDDNTAITVIQAVTAPSTAKIIAKSEDGKKIQVYNIIFTLDENGKEIAAIPPIEIITKIGAVPELPSVVTAVYSDEATTQVNVIWDEIDPEQYNHTGVFTVLGTVAGTKIKAKALVTVLDDTTVPVIVKIKPITITTKVGKAPELPTVVTAVYSNDTTLELFVDWDEIQPSNYAKPGKFKVEGTVEGTGFKAIANVTVKAIAEEKPFIIVSFSLLNRTKGIQATVNIMPIEDANQPDKCVALFQLMKGITPINIIALEKNIVSEEEFTAYFNVEDYKNPAYTVKVFVFDRLDSAISAPLNLAEPVELK